MPQQSILGRVSQILRANVNDLLDDAEDPEKMLDQMIRDFTNNIADAEEAVAQTIGNLRMLEDDRKEASESQVEWGQKAAAASRKADELRAAGNGVEADRFDGLAKIALKRQISFEEQVRTMDGQIAQQSELVAKLKDGLNQMRLKREELVTKRDELVARAKMAQAQTQVTSAMKSVNMTDPTSDLSRFEEKIRREEAKSRGMTEVAMSSLDSQFEALGADDMDLEVEARLAQLKGGASVS